jgi:hypothetical protein
MGKQRLALPFFDGLDVEDLRDLVPMSSEGEMALANFLALGAADRRQATRHVLNYCHDEIARSEAEAYGPETPLPLVTAETVWTHVHPKSILVEDRADAEGLESYVVIEADCDWEPEHGLMLCFRGGRSLTKCGPFDGHVSNRKSYPDDSLIGVVYVGVDPAFTTREDA